MEITIEEMKNFCKENNLCKLVAELNSDGNNLEGALQWVYDSHTMTTEEFRKKYFGF